MTRVQTRTNFHSSKLIRTLADLAVLETAGPASAFAEKLGSWIDFTDAIALTGVLNVNTPSAASAPSEASGSLEEEFSKARLGLERAIRKGAAPGAGRSRAEPTLPQLDVPLDDVKAYAPFRRYHQAHQRDMEVHVRNMRAKLRDGVAAASPRLRQLVALDAALEGILGEREAKLLSSLPSLFEKRFNHMRKAHLQAVHDGVVVNDTPDQWMKPGAWLARFCVDLQVVLLAELDLRLQTAVGLLEALRHETTEEQQTV